MNGRLKNRRIQATDFLGTLLPWSTYANRSDSSPSLGGVVPGSTNGPMGDDEPHRQSFVQQDILMVFLLL